MRKSVWLVIGDKLGDNAQVAVLANKLGVPSERRELRFKEPWVLGKPPFEPTLDHVALEQSDPLEPPWPDLIITVGRRPAMAALWVKRQSKGQTRLVLIGRPKRYFDEFDLVINTGQYLLPSRPNVLQLTLPLMESNEEAVAQAADAWRGAFAELPRPLTAVLVGGATKPFRFGTADAKNLLERVQQATGESGSLYVTTSRRTGSEVADALLAALPSNGHLFRWTAEAPEGDNPYLALLGSADRFVVTGDSISMMVEVARLRRPLAIARLPLAGGIIGRALSGAQQRLTRAFIRSQPLRVLTERLVEMGAFGYSRDFDRFHQRLRDAGWASFIEEGFIAPGAAPEDSATRAAAAVQELLQLPR